MTLRPLSNSPYLSFMFLSDFRPAETGKMLYNWINPLFRKLLFSESRIRFEKPEGNCLRLLEVTRVKMSRFNIWLANAFSSNLKTINLKILLHFVDPDLVVEIFFEKKGGNKVRSWRAEALATHFSENKEWRLKAFLTCTFIPYPSKRNSTKWSNILNNSSAFAEELFEYVWPFCGVGV